ncbi:MAG TPA: hypothetical protein VGD10_02235 [Allosphingosinicella sp.]|uniref:hypothetical protein n=1 Tax=Allosphingosinicella sp. TaxID=2823234 RepID=UPI002ED84BA2
MRSMSLILLLAAACSQQEDTTPSNAINPASAGNEAVDTSSEANILSNEATAEPPAAVGNEAAPPAEQKNDSAVIPAAFRGTWGGPGGSDCTATDGTAKARLVVGSDRLTFYEARGTVRKTAIHSPTSISVEADYEGEGMTWSKGYRLTLLDGGKRLDRRELEAPRQSFVYHRCPA